ncbi:Uncharacterised protein [Serratia marcescens]|nr:Uncharacterised protein [Serratia marcescens]CAI1133780.1 Uncharacterised protein [Serratia marcescens]
MTKVRSYIEKCPTSQHCQMVYNYNLLLCYVPNKQDDHEYWSKVNE